MSFLFGIPSTPELMVILLIGLLLFGRRLPEVGRQVGRGFMQFKRGLRDIEGEFREVDRLADESARDADRLPPVTTEPRLEDREHDDEPTTIPRETGGMEPVSGHHDHDVDDRIDNDSPDDDPHQRAMHPGHHDHGEGDDAKPGSNRD